MRNLNDTEFHVFPVADEHCDRLNRTGEPLASTATIEAAKSAARKLAGHYPYGVGILNVQTGAIDIGFGFGVKALQPPQGPANALSDPERVLESNWKVIGK